MNEACTTATAAIAAGEPPDSTHLAACEACTARAAFVRRLSPGRTLNFSLAPPTASGLRARWRRRVMWRAGASLAAAAMLVFALRPAPTPDVDLLAVLDDADRVVEPLEPMDEDLLALLEPGDPSAVADTLVDALLGEGSL